MSLFTKRRFFFYFPNPKTSPQYQMNKIQYHNVFYLENFFIFVWAEDMNVSGRKEPLV